MSLLRRIHDWCAEPPARSWFAHLLVAWVVALAVGGFAALLDRPLLGLLFGAAFAAAFYAAKEARDAALYWRDRRLGETHMGATRRADGWGDLVGPVGVLLTALAAWWLAR